MECISEALVSCLNPLVFFIYFYCRSKDFEQLELAQVIGSGGFGRVFQAKFGDSTVAVKQIASDGLSPKVALRKAAELRAEGELIASCRHVNIARIVGVCLTPPNFCLVMEYAYGGALSNLLEQVFLEPAVIVDWATQIARGMHYLHEEGPVSVVHRSVYA